MHICLVFNLDTLSFNQFLFVVEPLNLSLWNSNKSALQFSCVSFLADFSLRSLSKSWWNSFDNISQRRLPGQASSVVFFHKNTSMFGKGMVNNQFSRGRGKSNAIFSHTCKSASVFRENLFDDKSSFVILIIEDLEILRWFDD